MTPRLVVLLFVGMAFAGCAEDAPAPVNTPPPGHKPGSVADMPVWNEGDWWGFEDSMGRGFSAVVAASEGGDWLMLSNDLSLALADWTFDISWLGNVRKSDLAGEQAGGRPQYFDWPLEDGKTWTTTWDGQSTTVVSHAIEQGKWHIVATQNGKTSADYVYNPLTGWLDRLTFYNVDDGSVMYEMTTTGKGDGYQGAVFRYTHVEQIDTAHVEVLSPHQTQHTIGEEVTEMLISWFITCNGPGFIGVGLQEPQEDGSAQPLPPVPFDFVPGPAIYGTFEQCPDAERSGEELIEDVRPGVWRLDAAAGNQGSMDFWLDVRSYETIRL